MSNIICDSSDPKIAAVQGTQTGNGGTGVLGIGPANGVIGQSTGSGFSGVVGESATGPGVAGTSTSSVGVDARSESGPAALRAVHAGVGGPGVLGISKAIGVWGKSTGDGLGSSGVFGEATDGPGVSGVSAQSVGVDARSDSGPAGLRAVGNNRSNGVIGQSTGTGTGVFGESKSGVGVFGKGGNLAGLFEGDVRVTGKFQGDVVATGKLQGDAVTANRIDCPTGTVHCFDVSISNADCAEEFELAGAGTIEPGTLMSFSMDGTVCPSVEAYDNKVAGVISGAGEYKPGIVLDRRQEGHRVPIALVGKVYCKVDANYSAITVGDLLTTSPTAGHAMKATDHLKAFGSVIGKALRPKSEGRGIIPVLVALQ
jgi:hypothetical protein